MNQKLAIGRLIDNYICLEDTAASRTHGFIYLDKDSRVTYEDNKSSNGSTINGKKVISPTVVNAGDTIVIGDTNIMVSYFQIKGDPDLLMIHDGTPVELKPDEYKELYSVNRKLMQFDTIPEVADYFLHLINDSLNADKSTIVLFENDKTSYELTVNKDALVVSPLSSRVIDITFREMKPVLLNDAVGYFAGDLSDSLRNYGIQSVITVPMISSAGDKVTGLLYVDSLNKDNFTMNGFHKLILLCQDLAILVEKKQNQQQVEHDAELKSKFKKYVSPVLAEKIEQDKVAAGTNWGRFRI